MKKDITDFQNVCMLSTHGYFDPIPELGKIDTGGQILYVLNIAYSLAKMGINVDIYTRWFEPEKKQIEELPDSKNIRIIRIPAGGWEFIPKEQIYGVLPELAENMIDFIISNHLDYDLYHGHYVDAGIVALKVAERFSKPVYFTAHSLGAWKKQLVGGNSAEMDKIFNFKHRISEELRIFKSVTGQTVTSREEENKIRQLYHFQPKNLEFIPPGVDIRRFRPLSSEEREMRSDYDLPDKYMFMVSRTSKAKGHDLLLRAYFEILKNISDVDLVISVDLESEDREGKQVISNIKSFMKENQMEDHIRLIGRIPNEELPLYYGNAELYVLPARFEPFGMSVLEAMACQVPAVVSEFAGIQENLKEGKDYLKINPYDTEKFANTILKVLKNEKLAKRLALNGCRTVRNKFSWDAIAQKFVRFYIRCASPTN